MSLLCNDTIVLILQYWQKIWFCKNYICEIQHQKQDSCETISIQIHRHQSPSSIIQMISSSKSVHLSVFYYFTSESSLIFLLTSNCKVDVRSGGPFEVAWANNSQHVFSGVTFFQITDQNIASICWTVIIPVWIWRPNIFDSFCIFWMYRSWHRVCAINNESLIIIRCCIIPLSILHPKPERPRGIHRRDDFAYDFSTGPLSSWHMFLI